MIKYYTKEFLHYTEDSIADWLNKFEAQREGKSQSSYNIVIFDKSIIDNVLKITIKVSDFN